MGMMLALIICAYISLSLATEAPCVPNPKAYCTMQYDPYCCSGTEYSSLCAAQRMCATGCVQGACKDCTPNPNVMCTADWRPVCCAGTEYSNQCKATANCATDCVDGQCNGVKAKVLRILTIEKAVDKVTMYGEEWIPIIGNKWYEYYPTGTLQNEKGETLQSGRKAVQAVSKKIKDLWKLDDVAITHKRGGNEQVFTRDKTYKIKQEEIMGKDLQCDLPIDTDGNLFGFGRGSVEFTLYRTYVRKMAGGGIEGGRENAVTLQLKAGDQIIIEFEDANEENWWEAFSRWG